VTRVERAVFRPPMSHAAWMVLAGGAAGLGLAAPFDVPPLLSALFGAAAAGVTLAVRQARGLRAVADEHGLRVLGGGAQLTARWDELRLAFGLVQRPDGSLQRYAAVADPQGRSFAFAEPTGAAPGPAVPGADGRPVEVVDLREAALLLALLVERVPAWEVLPEELRTPPASGARAEVAVAAAGQVEAAPAATGPGRGRRPAAERAGLFGLVATLGMKLLGALTKLGGGALKAAKTANVGWAVASAATWSILFSWEFALAIMLQLFVHEYGHVHAMRRTGMKVKGMYFVPLLGALAVTEDSFTSRRQQAWVALNGPLWGSAFALLPAGLWLWTRQPAFAAVAAWWALLNLFNLLPIAPLDGGRVMQALAASWSSALGLAVSLLGLAGAVALGMSMGFSILWLVALLGALELLGEVRARAGALAMRLLPAPGRLGPPQWVHLRAIVGPPPGSPSEPLFLRNLELQERAARAVPMTAGQALRWGLAYVALAAALVLLVWGLRHVPGADAAAAVLS